VRVVDTTVQDAVRPESMPIFARGTSTAAGNCRFGDVSAAVRTSSDNAWILFGSQHFVRLISRHFFSPNPCCVYGMVRSAKEMRLS
jgi:hypothetical protein